MFNSSETSWGPLLLSFKIAICSSTLNALLGIGIAFALVQLNSKVSRIISALLTLPLVLPPTIIGYYLLVFFGKNGIFGSCLANLGIHLIFTWQGAVLASALVSFPLVLKSAKASFESIDNRMQDAARILGASKVCVFFQVTLPLASRGIIAGVLLAFTRALGEFGATIMIAGNLPGRTQTLSASIYDAMCMGNMDEVLNSIVVISLFCIVVLCFTESKIFTRINIVSKEKNNGYIF